jgi:hypothetical protein
MGKKLRTLGLARGNEEQIPNIRVERVHVSTGYNPVEGNRRRKTAACERSPPRNPYRHDSPLFRRCRGRWGSSAMLRVRTCAELHHFELAEFSARGPVGQVQPQVLAERERRLPDDAAAAVVQRGVLRDLHVLARRHLVAHLQCAQCVT